MHHSGIFHASSKFIINEKMEKMLEREIKAKWHCECRTKNQGSLIQNGFKNGFKNLLKNFQEIPGM